MPAICTKLSTSTALREFIVDACAESDVVSTKVELSAAIATW